MRQRSGSRLSWGLTPSSRHGLRESTRLPGTIARPGPSRASPRCSLRSAHRLSQPLGGLLLPRLCGLVSCRCHVQGFSLQGVSLSASLTRLIAWPCPLAVTASPARSPGPKPRAPFDETDRLQGFAPPESPYQKVQCYSFLQADPLMGFVCPLPGLPAPCRATLTPKGSRGSAHALGLLGSLARGRLRTRRSFAGCRLTVPSNRAPAYCRAGGLAASVSRCDVPA
jgi:hypothetical protein